MNVFSPTAPVVNPDTVVNPIIVQGPPNLGSNSSFLSSLVSWITFLGLGFLLYEAFDSPKSKLGKKVKARLGKHKELKGQAEVGKRGPVSNILRNNVRMAAGVDPKYEGDHSESFQNLRDIANDHFMYNKGQTPCASGCP